MADNLIVRALLERPDEAAMARLVDAARADALSDEDLAELARGLAASGARLEADPRSGDVASTGGPSSLSTLLCPLQLRARGVTVPKLGVPGRPAGGIDVLQTVPGFQPGLDPHLAQEALARSGYIHLLADERWAPLDAQLFDYRQRNGAQKLSGLVIASILAKKLAAGANGAGLEIRVSPDGNFGDAFDAARNNARRYNEVGRLLNLRPICVLTDGTRPYQPYIGRGEALLALGHAISGQAEGWLSDHVSLCGQMADAVAAALGIDVSSPVHPDRLREAHSALLVAHGATPVSFDERVVEIRASPRTTFKADRDGSVVYDLGRMRDLLVARQRAEPRRLSGLPSDPAGVILAARTGTAIKAGEPVMSVRVPEGEAILAEELASCALIRPRAQAPEIAPSSLEIVA